MTKGMKRKERDVDLVDPPIYSSAKQLSEEVRHAASRPPHGKVVQKVTGEEGVQRMQGWRSQLLIWTVKSHQERRVHRILHRF